MRDYETTVFSPSREEVLGIIGGREAVEPHSVYSLIVEGVGEFTDFR